METTVGLTFSQNWSKQHYILTAFDDIGCIQELYVQHLDAKQQPLSADNLIKYKKKTYSNVKPDNDFETESRYHRQTVVLLLIAHILSLQDVVLRSMVFLIFYETTVAVKFYSYGVSLLFLLP